jgi:hypothetical protein
VRRIAARKGHDLLAGLGFKVERLDNLTPETYVEVQTSLLADEHLPYLWLLFSAEGLDTKCAVAELLDASKRFAGDLAVQLRERIYTEVVPRLARAIAELRPAPRPTDSRGAEGDDLHSRSFRVT